ncbi:MAG TPA: right-handed parallel beta-helix repeat-containing protein [Actinomycetota bacterium]|nr:right-handed parallel beta-helix repeat-containing protein [Actinomycetota bacterium]
MTKRIALPVALLLVLLTADIAVSHEERPSSFPDGSGTVPKYRTSGPSLVVCKPHTPKRIAGFPAGLKAFNQRLYRRCQRNGFHHIQDAVDAVRVPGTRILVQPGTYREKPSLAPLSQECAPLASEDAKPLSYEDQKRCPHVENLIAIFGDSPEDEGIKCDGPLCNLQVEGTGRRPLDVIVNGDVKKLNVIRADRADGIYFRNFTVQFAEFNALYVIETDGFVIDRVIGRWNWEYGFLTFASDHGLYKNCEAYGNGDGGLYPGSAADLPPEADRPSQEIRNCNAHHNTIGVSGTAGDDIYVHDNRLHHNMVGVTLDSFFPNHPGLPQNSARFENNRIYSNNEDYYENYRNGTCDDLVAATKAGKVCPSVPVPIGTGIMLAGGNDNLFEKNYIFDNWRYGAMQFWVPATFRNENDPQKQYDTSHRNQYLENWMGVRPNGNADSNGTDFWWDEEGSGNCWDGNIPANGEQITSDPPHPLLPVCDDPGVDVDRKGNPAKTALLGPCATWSRQNYEPAGCDWMQRPAEPN